MNIHSFVLIIDVEIGIEDALTNEQREAFRIMDQESQKESGCIKYVSSVDVNNDKIIRISEMWESMEQLLPHFQTSHMGAFQAALGSLKTTSYSAKMWEVARELEFPN